MSGLGNDSEDASDKQLLEDLRQESGAERKKAFSAIYNRYHKDVLRVIKSKIKCEVDAEEIFCDVWETALRRLPKFEWREDTHTAQPLKFWLLKSAKYKRLEYFRKIKPESQNIPLEDAVAFIKSMLNQDETTVWERVSPILREKTDQVIYQALKNALNELNPQHKEILILTYYQEKNATQIGKILNMKPGTVRVYRKRGIEKLRKILATYFLGKGGDLNA